MDTRNLKLDKYDEAILYLTVHPEAIYDNWMHFSDGHHPHGAALFQYASNSGRNDFGCRNGCLTMIRESDEYSAANPNLTREIRNDNRIPKRGHDITPEHLPIFAEWQRTLDRELNRA